jgi:hypothetical protein
VGAISYVVVAVAAAAIGWLVAHLMPGLWRKVTHAPDVFVHIEVDPSRIYAGAPEWVGASFVLPSEAMTLITDRPTDGGCRQWRSWLWPLGAYDADTTEIRVALQGNANTTVLVDGLLIQVIERSDPQGHVLRCPVGGADITVRTLQADLDLEPCIVNYRDDAYQFTKPFAFTLSPGEVEVFHITATTTQRCLWTAELQLVVNGQRRTEYVDDDGQPFRTSGSGELPASVWSVRQHKWLDRPGGT